MSDVNGQDPNGRQANGQGSAAEFGQTPPRPPLPPRPPAPGVQPPQPASEQPTEPFPTQAFPAQGFPTEPFPTQAFSTQAFPADAFPTQALPPMPPQQFAGQQFPGQQFPGQQFPGQQQPFGAPPVPIPPAQQYPGQQFPGQQFPGQPYAGHPGGPGAGVPAPGFGGEPPRRRGMPGWAIAATAVGVAVLIGGGITAAVLLTQQPSEPIASASPTPKPTPKPTPSQENSPTPTPTPSPTPNAPDTDLVTGEYTTDLLAPFVTGPFWSVQVPSDWTIDEFDQGGWNRFSNADGCVFETYQGRAEVETDPESDQDGTFTYHDDLLELVYLKDVPADTREHTEYGYLWFTADTDGQVEFLFDEFVYPDAEGVSQTIAIASRTFSATDVTLFTMLTCPTEVMQADPGLFADTIESAGIVSW